MLPRGLADRAYRALLWCYPASFRREYGAPMAQLFRDLRRAARQRGRLAPAGVWMQVLIETAGTAPREHLAEIERLLMETKLKTGRTFDPSAVFGLLLAAVVIAAALLAKAVILQIGGTVALATGLAITLNLAAALIMERAIHGRGVVLLSTGLLIAASLLPLLWVAEAEAWLRENPINGFIIILVAAWSTAGRPRWPILAAAAILSAAQIAVAFI